MRQTVKKKDETPVKPVEEEVGTHELDDMNLFIRKTKLQSRILKKMTETLEQSIGQGEE
jgi:hypothetical protein